MIDLQDFSAKKNMIKFLNFHTKTYLPYIFLLKIQIYNKYKKVIIFNNLKKI